MDAFFNLTNTIVVIMPQVKLLINVNILSAYDVRLSPAFVNHHKDQLLELKEVQQVVVTVK